MADPVDRLISVVCRYLHLYAAFVVGVAFGGVAAAVTFDKWLTVEIVVQDRFCFSYPNFLC